jgi:hypothetical protein
MHRARPALPFPGTIAIAAGQAVGVVAAVGDSRPGFHLKFHQALRRKTNDLTQEVGVGGLLQQLSQDHLDCGHRRSLVRVKGRNETLPKIRNDRHCGEVARPCQARDGRSGDPLTHSSPTTRRDTTGDFQARIEKESASLVRESGARPWSFL